MNNLEESLQIMSKEIAYLRKTANSCLIMADKLQRDIENVRRGMPIRNPFVQQPGAPSTTFSSMEPNATAYQRPPTSNYPQSSNNNQMMQTYKNAPLPASPAVLKDSVKKDNISKDNKYGFNGDQLRAFEAMCRGDNVFLSGEAGTGKSYVLNKFIDHIDKNTDKNLVVCASTGIAAVAIGGTTIHRAFNVPLTPLINSHPKKYNEVILNADIIIIDEISMCRCDLFTHIARYIHGAELESDIHKQVIVVGDFYQLPPVLKDEDKMLLGDIGQGFAFLSEEWNSMHFHNVVLSGVVRQKDMEFVSCLNAVRRGDKNSIRWINSHASPNENNGVYLCGTNKQAESLNALHLESLKAESHTYESEEFGKVSESDRATSRSLTLKIGAKVMTLVNDENGRYNNGSIGEVVGFNDKSVKVKFGDIICTIGYYEWEIIKYDTVKDEKGKISLVKDVLGTFSQLPIRLAYAITIHKSQGQTYDKVNLYPYCFEAGQLYVALSRVTSINGLHLMQPINQKYLITSDTVNSFYTSLI